MELKLAQRIYEAIDECGENAKLYDEYQGRGLNRATVGVICNDFATIIKCIINCADLFCDDGIAEFDVKNLREDSFGSRVIIY